MFMLRSLGLNLVNRRGASLLTGCKQTNNPIRVLRSVGSAPKFYSTSEGPLGAIWPKFGPTFDLAHWSSVNESMVRPFLQEANSNPDTRPSPLDVWRMEGIVRTTFRALVSAQKLTVVGSDEEDVIQQS
jgi:hypothetical protein